MPQIPFVLEFEWLVYGGIAIWLFRNFHAFENGRMAIWLDISKQKIFIFFSVNVTLKLKRKLRDTECTLEDTYVSSCILQRRGDTKTQAATLGRSIYDLGTQVVTLKHRLQLKDTLSDLLWQGDSWVKTGTRAKSRLSVTRYEGCSVSLSPLPVKISYLPQVNNLFITRCSFERINTNRQPASEIDLSGGSKGGARDVRLPRFFLIPCCFRENWLK